MSIILDALRKSENERQTQSPAEFAAIPSSTASKSVPRWIWIVAMLLAINLVVLIGLLLRPDRIPPISVQTGEIIELDLSEEAAQPSFTDQVAVARLNEPAEKEAPIENLPAVETPPVKPADANYPSILEVRANGLIAIDDLHLDIHVYSTVPEDRFVFINMSKHREGSRLDEGPLVTEITPDGVVLHHQGTSFLLPRD